MSDLLVTTSPETLHSTVQEVVLLEHPGGSDIFETEVENVLTEAAAAGNELLTVEQINVLLTEGVQGPPGPGGTGGGGAEKSLYADASRPIAYVAYANRIVRLDYAAWPPAETTASTTDVHTDWPNRATLEYA